MNGLIATASVAMALLAPVIGIELFVGLGLLFCVVAIIALGPLRGVAVIAPLFLLKAAIPLVPAAFAAMGVMFLFDEKNSRPLPLLAWLAGAVMAGLSYSGLMASGGGSFGLYWVVIISVVTGLAMVALGGAPVPGLATPAIRSHATVLLLYGLSQLRWNSFIYGESFFVGVLVCAMLGVAAYKEKKIDKAGAILGVVLGAIIYVSLGIEGFVIMFFFIMLAVVATSISAYNHGEPAGYGTRGAGNTFANLGPAALFALFSLMASDPFVFNIGFCASLGAALSDTVSSELGRGAREKPVDIRSWERVEAGSNGAISVRGTALGILAALFMGVSAANMELVTIPGALAVIIGALAGNLADSWLGSAFENEGALTNNQVNGWSVFGGGAFAALIGLLLV